MRKSIATLIGVVLLLAVVVGVVLMRPEAVKNVFRSTAVITDASEIDGMLTVFARNPYKDDYDMMRIPGYVQNTSDRDIAAVKIEISLWEKENRKEIVSYEVSDVPAGRMVTFDANAGAIPGSRTSQVEVTSIEVYR
jgi:hypothetical protein